jgi:hypothetical protein
MTRKSILAVLVPAILLAACGQPQPADEQGNTTPAGNVTAVDAEPTPVSKPSGANAVAPAPAVSPSVPDLTPPALTPEAERGEKGARNVLLSFARAIELKAFDQAWALLSPADKRKWDRAAFARIFADLGKITVAIPNGTIEGAAGSSYYSAPVDITAADKDGRPVRIEGKAVLRRVNDVDGATPAQRRWHFETLTLDWTH